jgi:hypothetical protein
MAQNHFLTPLNKKRERVTITVRNAYLLWPNFAGAEGKFNRAGDRNFSIMMAEQDGLMLLEQGWTSVSPVKKRPDDDDPETYYKMPVSVRFDNYPPRIWLMSDTPESLALTDGKKDLAKMDRVMLDEETVEFLDRLEFEKIDMVISGSQWSVNNNSGRKAYLQSAFFTLYTDELEREYGVVKGIGGMGEQRALPAGEDAGARRDYDIDGEEVPF